MCETITLTVRGSEEHMREILYAIEGAIEEKNLTVYSKLADAQDEHGYCKRCNEFSVHKLTCETRRWSV